MVISASPAGIGFGNENVACSFVASSVTSARCVLPPAVIDTSPNVISAALSTIVDVDRGEAELDGFPSAELRGGQVGASR